MTGKNKYIIVILSILAVLFFTGLFNRSIEFREDVYIEKPVKVVYFSMMNPMKMDEWVVGFKKMESLDGFLNGPGSRYLLTLEIGGKELTILEEVTSFNWKRDLGLKFDLGHMIMDMMIYYHEEGDGCRLEIEARVKGTGLIANSIISFGKPVIKRQLMRNFDELKSMLEE